MTSAVAIGFERRGGPMPEAGDVLRAYEVLHGLLATCGAAPTHFFAAKPYAHGATYEKFGGAFHRKVIGAAGQGYSEIGLAVTPPGGDASGWESLADVGFSYWPEAKTTHVHFVASEPLLSIGSARCEEVIDALASLWSWDFGFGFARPEVESPVVYLAGGGSNRMNVEDSRRGELWYAATLEAGDAARWLTSVRDVFPYNMISARHLARALRDGSDLCTFIQRDPDSQLRPLTPDLSLWTVSADRTEAVRSRLRGTGVIISE